MEEILNANKLLYSLPIGVDAVSNSTTTINNFNPNSYETTGGDTMFVQFPKTTTYLDAQNSYIKLKLKVQNVNNGTLYCFSNYTNDQPVDGFSVGASVMNLIDSVELISEGGQCLFKELFVNEMQTVREYRNNISRKNYLSFMGGICDNDRADPSVPENRYPVYDGAKDTSFYIPLTEIGGGFFNGVLIPDLLLSNAILKIKLANVGQNTTSYSINAEGKLDLVSSANNNAVLTNVALILSQKELYEEVRETINKKLKSPEGLEYSYYTNFNTSYVFENNTAGQDYKIPLNLSAGKIKYVAIKPTLPQIQGLPVIPLASAVWDNYYDPALDFKTTVSYNMPFGLFVRLGNNVLSTYEVKTIPEMYEQTIRSLSNISYGDCQDVDVERCINKKSTGCVSFYNYAKLDRNAKMQSDYGVLFAFNFDRVEGLGVSGLSTGIERLLEINVSNFKTNNTPTWYFQIQYLQTANVFADGQIAVNR
jgi:hypothetical protein